MLRSTMYVTTPCGWRSRRFTSASVPSSSSGVRSYSSKKERKSVVVRSIMCLRHAEKRQSAIAHHAAGGQASEETCQALEVPVRESVIQTAQVLAARRDVDPGRRRGILRQLIQVLESPGSRRFQCPLHRLDLRAAGFT